MNPYLPKKAVVNPYAASNAAAAAKKKGAGAVVNPYAAAAAAGGSKAKAAGKSPVSQLLAVLKALSPVSAVFFFRGFVPVVGVSIERVLTYKKHTW